MVEALTTFIFLLLALVPVSLVIWLTVYATRRATRFVGVCRRCGYDLRYLGDRRECPECGQPFTVDAQGNTIS